MVGYRRSYIKHHLGQQEKIFHKSRLVHAPHKYNIAVEKANTPHIYFEVEFQYRTKIISLGLYCVCQHLMQISYRSFSFKTTQYGLLVLPKTAEGGRFGEFGEICSANICPTSSSTMQNLELSSGVTNFYELQHPSSVSKAELYSRTIQLNSQKFWAIWIFFSLDEYGRTYLKC